MPAAPPPRPPAPSGDAKARRFCFLLLPRFTMMSFAGAIEPLRLANYAAGRSLYEWRLLGEGYTGEGAASATCSNGARIALDGGLEELRAGDTILVCGGLDITRAASRPVLNWLRREGRRGVAVGGLCTGAWVVAAAGLLDGRKATIHWENHDGFAEAFPEVDLVRAIFVQEGSRLTAAGGTSSIDLMLGIIAAEHGDALAATVADQLIYTNIRTGRDSQRLSIPARIGVRHPRLAQVIARMEETVEEPVSPADLAEETGMSTRQLERLFRRYLGRSPKKYYMETRLARARNLLMQTPMSVIEVALACGFSSPSHFSKCYRAQYGATPYRERGTGGQAEDATR
ncbi:helix-turn-helix domain-containing protein [Paracoccus sp. S-4012]|uniref:GlxA family transcriptional regulator n=1 Tax=Paracoccus sp. S-4012 TaxID=2665648 RepID=UPI0012AF9724|nr:GlxA family transcriptional regulator [Paracoccus sp. S-4012]MRX51284.1 helix-turn-helix domain-containing protein [Paracoccus sp. S-4012]